jgi:hypothetical protein
MPEPQVAALLSVLARRGRKGGEDGEGEARKREAGRRQAERGPAREKGARKVERRTSSFSPQRREEA